MLLLFKTASLDVQSPKKLFSGYCEVSSKEPFTFEITRIDLNPVSTIVRVLNSCGLIKQTVKSRGWT